MTNSNIRSFCFLKLLINFYNEVFMNDVNECVTCGGNIAAHTPENVLSVETPNPEKDKYDIYEKALKRADESIAMVGGSIASLKTPSEYEKDLNNRYKDIKYGKPDNYEGLRIYDDTPFDPVKQEEGEKINIEDEWNKFVQKENPND